MNDICMLVKSPADFCNNILTVLKSSYNCKTIENDGEYIRYISEEVDMNMRRIILSKGFELFINKCCLYREVAFDVELAYDALEIMAYKDNETDKYGCHVKYAYFFWRKQDKKKRFQHVVFPKFNRTYITLYIDLAYLSQYINVAFLKEEEHNLWRELTEKDSKAVMKIMNELIHNNWHKDTQRLFFYAKSMEFISLITQLLMDATNAGKSDGVVLNDHDKETLESIQHIIQTRYYDNLTIENISKQVYRNTSWVKAMYKTVYGTTIHQDIINRRMNKALQLLRVEGLSVEETTRKIGYENPSHFISTFKRVFGMTPGEVIRKNGKL